LNFFWVGPQGGGIKFRWGRPPAPIGTAPEYRWFVHGWCLC